MTRTRLALQITAAALGLAGCANPLVMQPFDAAVPAGVDAPAMIVACGRGSACPGWPEKPPPKQGGPALVVAADPDGAVVAAQPGAGPAAQPDPSAPSTTAATPGESAVVVEPDAPELVVEVRGAVVGIALDDASVYFAVQPNRYGFGLVHDTYFWRKPKDWRGAPELVGRDGYAVDERVALAVAGGRLFWPGRECNRGAPFPILRAIDARGAVEYRGEPCADDRPALASDGERALVATRDGLLVVATSDGARQQSADLADVRAIAPDGPRFYVAWAGGVRRFDRDGGDATYVVRFEPAWGHYPVGVAVDATHVYWIEDGRDSAQRVRRAPKAAPEAHPPEDLAVDATYDRRRGARFLALGATHVYWGACPWNAMYGPTCTIQAVPKAGGDAVTLVADAGSLRALAADATHLYFTHDRRLERLETAR